MTIQDRATEFHRLHAPGRLLLLPNCWDAGSARLLASLGADAIATSSAALAWAHGYPDGECLPRARLVDTVAEITRIVDQPVTVDIERGYGASPAEVADTVSALIGAGAIGINIEDGDRDPADLVHRIEAARTAAERQGVRLFINARTDLWLEPLVSDDARLSEAIARGRRNAAAGADGFFVPRLSDPEAIRQIAAAVPLRVSLMAVPDLPGAATLRGLGVARVSLGVMTLLKAFGSLEAPLRAFLDEGRLAPMFEGSPSFAAIDGLFSSPSRPSEAR